MKQILIEILMISSLLLIIDDKIIVQAQAIFKKAEIFLLLDFRNQAFREKPSQVKLIPLMSISGK